MARYEVSQTQLAAAMAGLPGWTVVDGKLHKGFKFSTFAAAMGWMMAVSIIADKMDHHPEWANVYNRVTVNLATHDLGDVISNWDVELAQKMDEFAKGYTL